MGSKARARRMCGRKVAHSRRSDAERHAAHLRKTAIGSWEAYHCALADHWHVGRTKSVRGRRRSPAVKV